MRDLEMPTIIEKENNLIDPSKINPLDKNIANPFLEKKVGPDAPLTLVTGQMIKAYERLEKYSTGNYEFLGLGSVRNPLTEDNSLFLANLLFFNTERLPLEIREKASEVIATQLINSKTPLQTAHIYEDDLGITSLQDSLAAFGDDTFFDLKNKVVSPLHHPLMQKAFDEEILKLAEEKINTELDRIREEDLKREAGILTENLVLFSDFMNLINLSEDRNETTIQLIKSEFSSALNDKVDELIDDISKEFLKHPDMPTPLLRVLQDELNRYIANFIKSSSLIISYEPTLTSPSPDIVAEKFKEKLGSENFVDVNKNKNLFGTSPDDKKVKNENFYNIATEHLHQIHDISTAEFLIKSQGIPVKLEGLSDSFIRDFKIPRDDEVIPSEELEHQSFMCDLLLSTIDRVQQNELFQEKENEIDGLQRYVPSLENIKTILDFYKNHSNNPDHPFFPA